MPATALSGADLHPEFIAAGQVGVDVQGVLDFQGTAGMVQGGPELAGENPYCHGAEARVI